MERFGWIFAPGDKVMQVENDYDKEVYNGDIGRIESLDLEEGTIEVDFDGRKVNYTLRDLDMLVPAFATTILPSASRTLSISPAAVRWSARIFMRTVGATSQTMAMTAIARPRAAAVR